MTGIRIKILRQTGPYGRVPHRFWFVPNCEQGIASLRKSFWYTPFALSNGPLFSIILLSFWKEIYFKMAGIGI